MHPAELVLVCVVALLASGLTFYTGFGLGTLLIPAFALVFPVEVAIAATAVVHLANNLFKLGLVGRRADRPTVLRFALPAVLGAVAGAAALTLTAGAPPLATYTLGARTFEVTPVKLLVGLAICGFAALELSPRYERLEFPARWLPAGGLVSGFFGGLSGHQGALRAAFLVRLGLTPEQFVATGVVSAVLVDLARLAVYGGRAAGHWNALRESGGVTAVVLASVAAFAGSLVGMHLIQKVTMRGVRRVVGAGLLVIGAAMVAGVV
jgi:uncharacterized protein